MLTLTEIFKFSGSLANINNNNAFQIISKRLHYYNIECGLDLWSAQYSYSVNALLCPKWASLGPRKITRWHHFLLCRNASWEYEKNLYCGNYHHRGSLHWCVCVWSRSLLNPITIFSFDNRMHYNGWVYCRWNWKTRIWLIPMTLSVSSTRQSHTKILSIFVYSNIYGLIILWLSPDMGYQRCFGNITSTVFVFCLCYKAWP